MIRIGIDIGSTTAKLIAIDPTGKNLFSKYERHNAKAKKVVCEMLREMLAKIGDVDVSVKITGSVGMGMSEEKHLPFVQEVVAATRAIQNRYPHVRTMIDIGGEDAKIVFFKNAEATDLRMNGNCAGGTGSFIDQMAVILDVSVDELKELATQAKQLYPIASRCGVFCKTDIQNLIAKNVSSEDIAASIFHAVAVQTVMTLAHGCDIEAPVLMCGGPLTFIPALRKAFIDYLHLSGNDIIIPENGTLLPAIGSALTRAKSEQAVKLSMLIDQIDDDNRKIQVKSSGLQPIFFDEPDYKAWQTRIAKDKIRRGTLQPGRQDVFIGIDSGSTTTKIVVTDTEKRLLFHYYNVNGGNPIKAVENGLNQLKQACDRHSTELNILGSCSTGYGEDLIKTAFQLDEGIVETIAHYMGASHLDPDVSFILDIGGQDMKAIFVNQGVIDRIEINEACSSGCGSFIETFAKTLGYPVTEFALSACQSNAPSDLGSRCTVFMNSKVKQVLREGATIDDIAAGLAYSVVKNCLYKVLKLKDVSTLGSHIVVQGGTMRNDAVVRALELLTGTEVSRCDMPELMGAFGCALYAAEHCHGSASLDNILAKANYTSRLLHCKGCDNQCLVSRYRFDNGKDYYSGNRCERVFTNGESILPGENAYRYKNELLFDIESPSWNNPRLTIGIPRILNMYENYPFWHTLFAECGLKVRLSDVSNYKHYEFCARMVMSDNICFPAKLVHSHIENLIEAGVDRIFMPFVIFEHQGSKEQNSYNCPIVTGYSEVVKSVQGKGVPIDSPDISFKDKKLLLKQCRTYLKKLGVEQKVVDKAFKEAMSAQENYGHKITAYNDEVLKNAQQAHRPVILLAGRPYHTDPLIQHKISDMVAGMGIDVITDDIVRDKDMQLHGVNYLDQWTYPNRILKAAQWVAEGDDNLQFVQLTSFGCGPDAFLVDVVRDLLMRHGKAYTMLKLDDINNVGSMKLRVRSLVASLKLAEEHKERREHVFVHSTPLPSRDLKQMKIVAPYFTPFISPLIPAIMRVAGYDVENLEPSDVESADWGLRYSNNEVCYPATLIVGDVIKAFKDGRYDPNNTVVAMTQTGGQCRASNYIALIRKALADAGYPNTPVVSLTAGETLEDGQAGIKLNWFKIMPIAIRSILYSDCISKFYYASVVREKQSGLADRLKNQYLDVARKLILEGRTRELYDILGIAARRFNSICHKIDRPRVGIVGEIFLKFNPFAHKNLESWLANRDIEVVPSMLTDFFMQSFVNRKVRIKSDIENQSHANFIYNWAYSLVKKQIQRVNSIGKEFKYFSPFNDIFEEAKEARQLIDLNAQFGEGWLLPAEVMSYSKMGVNSVVSLQPFGCIANHIVSKGIEKRIKELLPDMNFLSLDFDSGVSDVNISNRLLLFIDNLRQQPEEVERQIACS